MTGLLGSTVLEVLIGIAFLYLLLAIFCTAVNEWIAGLMKTRARMLEATIRQLLDGQPLAQGGAANGLLNAFYSHSLILGLAPKGALPSYVPARTFAKALMDQVTANQPGSITHDDLEAGIKALPDGYVKTALLALIQNTGDSLDKAQKAIEGWFDDAMERLSGWYKRRTQVWTIVVAAVLTVLVNADTLHVAHTLWIEPTARSAIVEAARARVEQPPPATTTQGAAAPSGQAQGGAVSEEEQKMLAGMLGWQSVDWNDRGAWFGRVIGWILTIIAVSLGAPFWFDTLSKFMNVRASGKSPGGAEAQPTGQTATQAGQTA
jgi:hypothetical protein